MLLRIKKATYAGGYKIEILFSNEKRKLVNFEPWIFEDKKNVYLGPLKDIEFFKKFEIDSSHYTLCWPNGADFCPDRLYEIGRAMRRRPKKKRTSLKSHGKAMTNIFK